MEYNTKRDKLMFYDYGRNIYKMIEYAKTIEDRAIRTLAARNIIKAMAMVNPAVKENADYNHMLWDHLMIWSNFELDVDCPYPIEHASTMKFKPNKLHYNPNHIRYRHYGKLMENMIKKAIAMPAGAEKDCLVNMIANQMKKDYIEYNYDSVSDDLLDCQLRDLSDGKLSLSSGVTLEDYTPDPLQKESNNSKKKQQQKKKNKSKRNY